MHYSYLSIEPTVADLKYSLALGSLGAYCSWSGLSVSESSSDRSFSVWCKLQIFAEKLQNGTTKTNSHKLSLINRARLVSAHNLANKHYNFPN